MNRLKWWMAIAGAGALLLTACPDDSTSEQNHGTGFDVGERDTSTADTSSNDTASSDTGGELPSELVDCSTTNYCVLSTPGCCSPCGEPSFEDLIAISSNQSRAFKDATCHEVDPICPGCPTAPTNPNYLAMCTNNTCEKQDLRLTDLSACTSDDECIPVRGQCCACEDAPVVAINSEHRADFNRVICDPLADCAPCDADPPTKPTACVNNFCQIL